MAKLFWLSVSSIIYTYFGYPLLLTLLARFRSNKPLPKTPMTYPFVTVLIAAYNEQSVIAGKLENSLKLDYPSNRLQILVAADGSDDKTVDIVRSYQDQGVELSYNPLRQGKMAAINRAISKARGEIIIFSDANNSYDQDALKELIAPFIDQNTGAVSGAKSILQGNDTLSDSEGLYWKYESFIKEQETQLGCCTGVAGEIFAIRRDLFEFPPDDIINDDFYMAMRLIQRGYNVVYTPKARSSEAVSLSAQDEITRRARIVAGRYQAIALAHRLLPRRRPVIVWQIVSHKFLRPLVPLAMLGALLTNLAAVIWPVRSSGNKLWNLSWPFNWIMLSFQGLFYGMAFIGNYTERNKTYGKLLYLPTFLVNSNSAALMGLYRFLTGHQSTLWQRVPRREELSPPIEIELAERHGQNSAWR